jgi:hypothetical protein
MIGSQKSASLLPWRAQDLRLNLSVRLPCMSVYADTLISIEDPKSILIHALFSLLGVNFTVLTKYKLGFVFEKLNLLDHRSK